MGKDDKASVEAKTGQKPLPDAQSSASEVEAFLDQVKSLAESETPAARGRLIFAMDATMSRQPTWDMALGLQAGMFSAVKAVGGLDVQLVYFRGFGECRSSKWVKDPEALAKLMAQVSCRGGHTQIGRVLTHARKETNKCKVNALVYVGDCMEENIDDLAAIAGDLGLLGMPVFLFQEGNEPTAEVAFREIARLTRGAFCRFDAGSSAQLRELLSAVAVYAAGGCKALENFGGGKGNTRALLEQLS
ncbi:MAG: VWA domain-containing protein [Methyloligellaceae bacterium]